MSHKTVIEDVLAAMRSVRSRAQAAHDTGDKVEESRLMADLISLHLVLETETQCLVDEMEAQ